MKRTFAAIVMSLLVLTGCSAIGSGVITKKEFTPAHSIPVVYCGFYNPKGICSVWLTRQDYIADSWRFDIEDDKQEGFVYVKESTFNDYNVGDYFQEKK